MVGLPLASEVLIKLPDTTRLELTPMIPLATSIPPNSLPLTSIVPFKVTVEPLTSSAASPPVPV